MTTNHPEKDILKARKALVTGGSSGIGYSVVKKFCGENIETAFADVSTPKTIPRGSHYFHTDVTDGKDVQELYGKVRKSMGIPDILVCNAGRGIHETLSEGDPEKWIKIFAVNVFGTLRIIRAFLPDMRRDKLGDIVFISSVSARSPYEGGAIYSGTKSALEAIAETLRLEVQPSIRVTTIVPGVVNTNFFKNMVHGTQTPESIGWGAIEPDQIADAIFYAVTRPQSIVLNNVVIRPVAQVL